MGGKTDTTNQETMRPEKRLAIEALENLKTNDLERLEVAYRNMTQEQMTTLVVGSRRTRQQIIDECRQERNDIEAAIAWVKAQP